MSNEAINTKSSVHLAVDFGKMPSKGGRPIAVENVRLAFC